ncbi:MAG: NADH-quinone oxidoreductase subunit N, partial [Chitinophagaceae bacterium]|nr:NADH-quinone oxidoreductase subunit N [Chitinophagaceae bacterium]
MVTEFFILLKQELVITAIIFLLLFLKLGKDRSNESILTIVNFLLFVNLAAGFFGSQEGTIFHDMFRTNSLIVIEKNILNLAFWLISLQSYAW